MTLPAARILSSDDPLAIALGAALKAGEVDRLGELLARDRSLAACVVVNAEGAGRTPLHLFADWPGHVPNAAAVVRRLAASGADLDAPAVGMWHQETPLHWAASNDDVDLIDALIDAGADIERAGSSIDGGPALSSAVGYGQWRAAARLVERGAETCLWHEAALGLLPAIRRRFADERPPPEAVSAAFWSACHGGVREAARFLLSRGADLNWPAPWSGETPLDVAEKAGRTDVADWLGERGAVRGKTRP